MALTTKEEARRKTFRNLAVCAHWALWKRNVTEEALVENLVNLGDGEPSGPLADLVRRVLIGAEDGSEVPTHRVSDIMFALGMRFELRVEADETPEDDDDFHSTSPTG